MSPNHRGRIQFAVPPDFFVFLQKQTQRAANDCSSAITDATRHNLLVITTFNLQLPKGIPHARLYPLPPDGGSLEKATTYVLVSGHSLFIIWKNCTYLWAVCQRAFYRIKLPCHRKMVGAVLLPGLHGIIPAMVRTGFVGGAGRCKISAVIAHTRCP